MRQKLDLCYINWGVKLQDKLLGKDAEALGLPAY